MSISVSALVCPQRCHLALWIGIGCRMTLCLTPRWLRYTSRQRICTCCRGPSLSVCGISRARYTGRAGQLDLIRRNSCPARFAVGVPSSTSDSDSPHRIRSRTIRPFHVLIVCISFQSVATWHCPKALMYRKDSPGEDTIGSNACTGWLSSQQLIFTS